MELFLFFFGSSPPASVTVLACVAAVYSKLDVDAYGVGNISLNLGLCFVLG